MAKKKVAKKKPAKKKPAKRKGGARKSGLTTMTCEMSADLEAIVGAKKATRPQIVKKIWAYIKAHKLQDTKNRRMINPDKKLGTVVGNKSIDMLKLAGAISKHIKK